MIVVILVIVIMIIIIIVVIIVIIVVIIVVITASFQRVTANLRTNIMDFRGFNSSVVLIIRSGILMSIGDFPESLSQAILVGIMLVGKLGVWKSGPRLEMNKATTEQRV